MAEEQKKKKTRRPPTTLKEKEDHLIGLAVDLVEQKLRNGTATSQETTHLLKLASTRERLEQERLEAQIALDQAKIESLEAQGRLEELYGEAISWMKRYAGHPEEEEVPYDD